LWLAKKNVPGVKKYAALLKETIDHYVNRRKIDIREPKRVRGIGVTGEEILAFLAAATPVLIGLLPVIAALAGKTPSDNEFNDLAKTYGDGTTDTPPADFTPKGGVMAGGITPLLIAGGLAAALLLTGKKSK